MREARTAALSVALLALAAGVTGGEVQREFQESFRVREGMTLVLHHGDGDVTIRAWDRDEVDIKVRYRAQVNGIGFGGLEDFKVRFAEQDEKVVVTSTEIKSRGFRLGSTRRLENSWEVQAPAYMLLQLRGRDSKVQIEAWRGAVDCELRDAQLYLRDVRAAVRIQVDDATVRIDGLAGDLSFASNRGSLALADVSAGKQRIRSRDGQVIAARCDGELDIEVGGGDVDLREMWTRNLRVRSENADVKVGLKQLSDLDIDIATTSGAVIVDLPNGGSTAFDLGSDSGNIRVDLPAVENLDKTHKRVSGNIRKGYGRIDVRTRSGAITLRESRRGG